MKISIITVTYNRAHIIRDAIESVLLQKYKNYEYIIVDGASKDNTIEVLKEYEPKFEGRMRWVSEPDEGLYDAINKGIKMATGDVVGIINSDDFFHRPDTFDIIAKAFSDSSIEAIYADERDVNPRNLDTNSRYCIANYFKPWMFRFGLMPAHATFYAKKSLFESYGYYKTDYKIAADMELMIRFMYVHNIKTKYIPEPLMTFREGGVSTQLKNRHLNTLEQIKACRENGLYTNYFLMFFKYPFKIRELFIHKNRK